MEKGMGRMEGKWKGSDVEAEAGEGAPLKALSNLGLDGLLLCGIARSSVSILWLFILPRGAKSSFQSYKPPSGTVTHDGHGPGEIRPETGLRRKGCLYQLPGRMVLASHHQHGEIQVAPFTLQPFMVRSLVFIVAVPELLRLIQRVSCRIFGWTKFVLLMPMQVPTLVKEVIFNIT